MPSLSSQLLLRNSPNFFDYSGLSPMCLSSRNRSIYKDFRHILPYYAQVYKGMIYSKTGVPWQMNKTFIIIFFLLKCLVLPYFTHFFEFLQDLQFSGNCSKSGKTRQFEAKCSSLQQSIEYSCAAEPPVQCRVSHLSRRSEPQ